MTFRNDRTRRRVVPTIIDLLLPRTDASAGVQAVVALVVYGAALFAVRRNKDLLLFVGGLATITFAWFALRTVH